MAPIVVHPPDAVRSPHAASGPRRFRMHAASSARHRSSCCVPSDVCEPGQSTSVTVAGAANGSPSRPSSSGVTSTGVTSCGVISPRSMASAQWQATRWPSGTPGRSTTRSCGRSSSHRVSWRHGQRVWNRHPVGGFDGRGQVTGEQDLLAAVLDDGVGHGHGREQRPGVRVQRLGVEVVGGGLLDHAAEVHHADPVADVPHDGQVVGDDEVGEVELAPAARRAG